MKIYKQKINLQKDIIKVKNLTFIPTMGALHKGHVELIKNAKRRFGKTIVSIFINPKQFNSKKDFKSYPRSLKTDIKLLKNLRVDYLYLPNYMDIFSFKAKKKIYLHRFSKQLCGKFRKTHFPGVVNVVNRFLEIIDPKYILLGKKDFQQLFLVKEHIKKNKIKTKVLEYKTIREINNIACSSRNKNLNNKEIKLYSKIIKILKNEKKKIKKNNILNINKKNIFAKIKKLGVKKIDYIEYLDLKTLKKPKNKKSNFNIFIAFYLRETRLIDNF